MSQYINASTQPINLGNGVVIPVGGIIELQEQVAERFAGLRRVQGNRQMLIEAPIGYAEQIGSDASLNESIL